MIKIFFILNRKVTPQKNGCVGCWLLALPRAQMTRLSRILGIWFTYYVPVLINFMTPSKHLSIAYQGINLRRLLRFFFLSKAPHWPWRIHRIESSVESPTWTNTSGLEHSVEVRTDAKSESGLVDGFPSMNISLGRDPDTFSSLFSSHVLVSGLLPCSYRRLHSTMLMM